MFIKRVCVEEGFLHGLDLELDQGLTVLIGARGCGKTSIIELVRFALEAPSYSQRSGELARRQATEVLGSGKVTVTVDLDGEELVFSRSAAEDSSRRSSERPVVPPIVLSQNEIEQVGLLPDSRLRLLDGFVPLLRDNARSEDASRALISSLTVQLRGLVNEYRTAEEEYLSLASVQSELVEARVQANEAVSHVEQATDQRLRLDELGKTLAPGAVRLDLYKRTSTYIENQLRSVEALLPDPQLDPWPSTGGSDDRLKSVRDHLAKAGGAITTAVLHLREAYTEVATLHQEEQKHQLAMEDEARTLRAHLDQLSAGAGVLLKRVSDLEISVQRRAALHEQMQVIAEKRGDVATRRNAELDRLDALRDARINAREEAAATLNRQLGPRVRITVNRFGSVIAYSEALAESLRGSGVQYNVLAPELAVSISPRELAIAAETDNAEAIASITGIAFDRAQKIATHLRDVGTENVITAPLGDTVELALLDGGSYKPAEKLSVGQRCTAVLPIILSHTERVIVVDQPEDNLDNSFIADTLVRALRNRPPRSQLIFATHNANVPVLGEADRVVYLTSDGKRGDVSHAGLLDDPDSVRAISDVMEGGQEAFATRAAFYGNWLPPDEPS